MSVDFGSLFQDPRVQNAHAHADKAINDAQSGAQEHKAKAEDLIAQSNARMAAINEAHKQFKAGAISKKELLDIVEKIKASGAAAIA